MAMLPFAFSVHNFISSIGADAGFAAIIGLAVLILLYFAHARETANLRDEAALLTQRLHQAEARVLQLSRGQTAAAPAPQAAEPAVPGPLAPFAPAGMAAPALAAATRVVPLVEPPGDEEPADATQEPVAVPVAAMAMAGVGASAASAESPVQAPEVPPVPAAPSAAGEATPPAVPAPATSAGGNGAGSPPVPPPPRSAEPAFSGQIGASRGTPSAARQRPPLGPLPPLKPERKRSRLGRGVVVALAALAAVAVAVVVFALTSSVGSSNPTPASKTTNVLTPSHPGTVAGFKPASVTVAVLNGTSTNQLAHRVGQKLAAFGYKEGTIATAASQTQTATVVAYVGSARRTRATDRADALHVARSLGLRRSAVQPIDQSTLQVACPAAAACTANVVVTVGADLANL